MKRAILIRLSIGVLVLTAILASLLEINRQNETVIGPVPATLNINDPRRAELRRCQEIGQAAMHDDACLTAWEENRRRFMGPKPASNGGN